MGIARSRRVGERGVRHVRRASRTHPVASTRRRHLTITAMSRLLGQIWRVAKRHSLAACICIATVLLPSLAFAYSSTLPNSYSATVQAAVYAGGRDPLTETTTLKGGQLKPYLSSLTSLDLAEAALKRLPEAPPPSMAGIIVASRELLRETRVRLGPKGTTFEIVVRTSSQARAAAIADAFVGALQERRAAEAQSLARQAVAGGLELAARLPRDSRARRAAIAEYVRRLVPVIPDRNVQIVQSAAAESSHFLAVVGIAAAIAVLALLMLLILTGVWRPHVGHT